MINFKVLSNQTDTKLETDELASDLISAIKEFEETTAKIAMTHQSQETKRNSVSVNEMNTLSRDDEKGPVDCFNRAKESLRHVTQIQHDINNNNNEQKSMQSVSDATQQFIDGNELAESYVKIPVQQLINTFEKQMRSIIKQKVNENIQLKMEGTTGNSKISTTYINKDNYNGIAEKENELKTISNQCSTATTATSMTATSTTITQNSNTDSIMQQQTFDSNEHLISHSIDEQYQWSSKNECDTTTVGSSLQQSIYDGKNNESTTINRLNQTQPDDNFDGGKTKTIYNFYISRIASLTVYL